MVDPQGNAVRYAYDADGDLVSVTDRLGNVTRFKYEAPRPHYLTEVIDPLGRTGVRSEYDDQGRMVTMLDAAGNSVQLVHDPDKLRGDSCGPTRQSRRPMSTTIAAILSPKSMRWVE